MFVNFGELMEEVESNETKSITQTSQKLIKTLFFLERELSNFILLDVNTQFPFFLF